MVRYQILRVNTGMIEYQPDTWYYISRHEYVTQSKNIVPRTGGGSVVHSSDLRHSFLPIDIVAHPVSVLILPPREIQAVWSPNDGTKDITWYCCRGSRRRNAAMYVIIAYWIRATYSRYLGTSSSRLLIIQSRIFVPEGMNSACCVLV